MAGIADILISLIQFYFDHNKTNKTIAGQTFQFFMEEINHLAEASDSQNIHNHTTIFLLQHK